jgi:hypothetical protein
VYAAIGIVLSLLVLLGWQVVASYQRSLRVRRGQTGYLEATA